MFHKTKLLKEYSRKELQELLDLAEDEITAWQKFSGRVINEITRRDVKKPSK